MPTLSPEHSQILLDELKRRSVPDQLPFEMTDRLTLEEFLNQTEGTVFESFNTKFGIVRRFTVQSVVTNKPFTRSPVLLCTAGAFGERFPFDRPYEFTSHPEDLGLYPYEDGEWNSVNYVRLYKPETESK